MNQEFNRTTFFSHVDYILDFLFLFSLYDVWKGWRRSFLRWELSLFVRM